jgi:hypothetical protein
MAMFTQDIPFDDLLFAFAGEGSDVSEDATKINSLLSQVLFPAACAAVKSCRRQQLCVPLVLSCS